MESTKELLQILVSLSMADDDFAKEEQKFIIELGINGGLSREEVDGMISGPHSPINFKNISSKNRLSYIITVIQLMKADGKVRRSEIQFCERIAIRLGYSPSVVASMSQFIYADSSLLNLKKLEEIAEANSVKI